MQDASALPSSCVRWLREVDHLLRRDYCIGTDDAGFSVEDSLRYWGYGDSPEMFVEWFAEKYDLTRRVDWEWNPGRWRSRVHGKPPRP